MIGNESSNQLLGGQKLIHIVG